jgi:hypothetical protein
MDAMFSEKCVSVNKTFHGNAGKYSGVCTASQTPNSVFFYTVHSPKIAFFIKLGEV